MRGRQPRFFPPKLSRPHRPFVDMNRPGSPQYTERHRRKVWEVIPGMVRVDIGSEGD